MKKAGDIIIRVVIGAEVLALIVLTIITLNNTRAIMNGSIEAEGFIKYVEFNASCDALKTAYNLDVESHSSDNPQSWIDLLAYAACRGGGEFNKSSVKYINDFSEKLKNGNTVEDLTKDMKYYKYYKECYSAVLDGMVGDYEVQNEAGEWDIKYGLKAYNPIAKGFSYADYDDFGASRDYGYKRQHLGHDMMGMIGTPIIAVESGYVEVLGWNQYGGWRIGIRSFNGKRYYYYAHLRQNRPFAEGLKEGDVVTAGDVIGYMGHTGYSAKENVNNINQTHLHFGIELVFDESQKESNNEIWIDCYALTLFLNKNRSEATKNEETKEWTRISCMKDPAAETYKNEHQGDSQGSQVNDEHKDDPDNQDNQVNQEDQNNQNNQNNKVDKNSGDQDSQVDMEYKD